MKSKEKPKFSRRLCGFANWYFPRWSRQKPNTSGSFPLNIHLLQKPSPNQLWYLWWYRTCYEEDARNLCVMPIGKHFTTQIHIHEYRINFHFSSDLFIASSCITKITSLPLTQSRIINIVILGKKYNLSI